jgi:hypothetical protein
MTAEADATDVKIETRKTESKAEAKISTKEISYEELREVREEAKNNRLKHKAVSSEFELYKLETEAKLKSAEDEKLSLKSNLEKYKGIDKKIVESELKTQAVLAGIKDTDLVKLVDTSKIAISEDGVVDSESLKSAINILKESKPFLFGEDKKNFTSSNASTNAKPSQTKVDAMEMSKEEFQKAKSAWLRK